MKVAFWSNVNGKCSTTANTIALSVMQALECNQKVVVFENHAGLCGLDSAFIHNSRGMGVVSENSYVYNNIGMESILRKMHKSFNDIDSINNNVISFLNDRLLFIPGDSVSNEELFEYELNLVIEPLLKNLEQFADNVFVDTANNNNLSTKIILNEADIVVVNITQNQRVIEDFFENYSGIMHKAFFLVGNYEPYSRFDITAIAKRYQINPDAIAAVPYNYEFRESLATGTVVDFIERNHNCKKRDNNYYFMTQLRKSAIMLNNKIMLRGNGGR